MVEDYLINYWFLFWEAVVIWALLELRLQRKIMVEAKKTLNYLKKIKGPNVKLDIKMKDSNFAFYDFSDLSSDKIEDFFTTTYVVTNNTLKKFDNSYKYQFKLQVDVGASSKTEASFILTLTLLLSPFLMPLIVLYTIMRKIIHGIDIGTTLGIQNTLMDYIKSIRELKNHQKETLAEIENIKNINKAIGFGEVSSELKEVI